MKFRVFPAKCVRKLVCCVRWRRLKRVSGCNENILDLLLYGMLKSPMIRQKKNECRVSVNSENFKKKRNGERRRFVDNCNGISKIGKDSKVEKKHSKDVYAR